MTFKKVNIIEQTSVESWRYSLLQTALLMLYPNKLVWNKQFPVKPKKVTVRWNNRGKSLDRFNQKSPDFQTFHTYENNKDTLIKISFTAVTDV